MALKLRKLLNSKAISELTGIPDETVYAKLHNRSLSGLDALEKEKIIDVLKGTVKLIETLISKTNKNED